MSEQNWAEGIAGQTDHPQHRAPEGEGSDAPPAQYTGEAPQHSIFDGAGNETVVVTADDPEGRRASGTGATAADAARNIAEGREARGGEIGTGYGPTESTT